MKRDDFEKSSPGDESLDAEALRNIAEEIASEFPPPQIGTELVLLEVDPTRAHAYWSIDLDDFLDARLDAGSEQAPLVLRMYDITGVAFNGSNALDVFDAEIQGLHGHHYVDLVKFGRSYIAEIGFRRGDASLAFLARSNEVHTPPAEQSSRYDTSALKILDAENEPLPTDLKLADAVVEQIRDAGELPFGEEFPISEPPVAESAGEEVASSPEAAPPDKPLEPEPLPIGPWPEPEEVVHEAADYRERVQAFYKATESAGAAITNAESEIRQAVEPEGPIASEVNGGRREGLAAPAPVESSAAQPAPAPLGSYVNLSSFENGRGEVELEINTEIHIYGRAKPGSDLMLFGQKVVLRPDGTFSIRKPLPQGAVVLPLFFSSNGPGA